jgi:putative hydrolase of the HAD superfamily
MIKAIALDFDGVVVDSEKYWFNLKIKALRINKIKIKNIKFSFKFSGINAIDFFKIAVSKKNFKTDKKKYLKTYYSLKQKHQFIPKLNPYIKKIVKNQKKIIGIVSNNDKKYIKRVLIYYNLFNDLKNNIISYKDFNSKKPSPIGYRHFIKKNILNKKQVLVIEDSMNGYKAAKNAGIKNILVFQKNKKLRYNSIRTLKNVLDI